MNPNTSDVLVIGGGVIGLTIALEARRRDPTRTVTLIDKESAFGVHASGRNSGVLHAGFYYSSDSLKARLCREGNRRLTEYCVERDLPINRCGKLVVAQHEGELAGLDELLARGQRNGVQLEMVSAREARELEPSVKTHERALHSPTTSSVDPQRVVASFVREAREAGVELVPDTAYRARNGAGVITNQGRLSAGYVINAAGLYADRIAKDFGFGDRYAILPFKGLYLYANPGTERLGMHVYPVPNLGNPWLGVHFTITVDGKVKIGPTAIPAFWREHYHGLRNFRLGEFLEVCWREAGLFVTNDFDFRRVAWEELRKYSRGHLAELGSHLVHLVDPANFRAWGQAGIRAQLFDRTTRRLEMDFRYEGDNRSFHVLNAVSPAFTCALPFAELMMDEIERRWA